MCVYICVCVLTAETAKVTESANGNACCGMCGKNNSNAKERLKRFAFVFTSPPRSCPLAVPPSLFGLFFFWQTRLQLMQSARLWGVVAQIPINAHKHRRNRGMPHCLPTPPRMCNEVLATTWGGGGRPSTKGQKTNCDYGRNPKESVMPATIHTPEHFLSGGRTPRRQWRAPPMMEPISPSPLDHNRCSVYSAQDTIGRLIAVQGHTRRPKG